jgi:hypothetical protein
MEEVDELLHILQARNRRWYSQGAVEAPREWIEVTNSNDTEWLRDHLRIGHALPLQRSFYDRVAKFTTRLIMAAERDLTFQAVQAQITCAVEKFGDGPIFILTRISPYHEQFGVSPSLNRQHTFIAQVLESSIEPTRIRLPPLDGVSAYSEDAATRLALELEQANRRCLVLSTTVDSVARKTSQLDRVHEIIINGGHVLMTFIWQFDSVNACTEPDFLHSVMPPSSVKILEHQLSIAAHNPSSYPILWPMLWVVETKINPVVIGDLHQAESYCLGFSKSSWQGNPNVAIDERIKRSENDIKKGLSLERRSKWFEYCAEKLNVDRENIKVLTPDDSGQAWHCSCPGMVQHDDDCLCPCQHCNTRRIIYCHCSERYEEFTNPKPPTLETIPEPERHFICKTPGCDKTYTTYQGLRFHRNNGKCNNYLVLLNNPNASLMPNTISPSGLRAANRRMSAREEHGETVDEHFTC